MKSAGRCCRRGVIGFLVSVVCVVAMLPSSALSKEASPMPGQRVVLVTGSTGGLGRETALALAPLPDVEEMVAELVSHQTDEVNFREDDPG